MQVGAQFTAFRKGDVIRDPSTGEVLGSNDVRLGQVEVTAVAPKFSTAMPIDFEPGVVAVGDVLRPATSKIKPKKKKK